MPPWPERAPAINSFTMGPWPARRFVHGAGVAGMDVQMRGVAHRGGEAAAAKLPRLER